MNVKCHSLTMSNDYSLQIASRSVRLDKKVTMNYYLRNLAERDPDTGRILTGYGRKTIEQAIIEGRVRVDEQGRIYVSSLKNL